MKRIAIYLRVSDIKAGHRQPTPRAGGGRQALRLADRPGVRGRRHQRRQGPRQAPWPRRDAEGRQRQRVRYGRAWSVDRLGRSLTDLLGILQNLHDKGVDLFLHQQGLDTSTSAGKAMFQMLGVFAEFERGIIRERVNAGLARARAKGDDARPPPGQALGRGTHPRAPRRRHGHAEDRSHRRRRHFRRAACARTTGRLRAVHPKAARPIS